LGISVVNRELRSDALGLCSATTILPIILLFRKVAYMRVDFERVLVWTVILACIVLGIAGGMSGAVARY
jgi:hypothetical protein